MIQWINNYGVRYESGKLMVRDKVINIEVDNIEIDGEIYMSTPGLRALIAERNLKEYSSGDYERYKELLYETNIS